jgi:hypothetical protein
MSLEGWSCHGRAIAAGNTGVRGFLEDLAARPGEQAASDEIDA